MKFEKTRGYNPAIAHPYYHYCNNVKPWLYKKKVDRLLERATDQKVSVSKLRSLVERYPDFFRFRYKGMNAYMKKLDRLLEKATDQEVSVKELLHLAKNHPYFFNLDGMNGTQLTELLTSPNSDFFKQFIDISDMPRCHRLKLFLKEPDAYIDFMDFDKFQRPGFLEIAKEDVTLFRKYDIPVSNLCIDSWIRLVESGEYSALDFLDNCKSIKNSGHMKKFFGKFPTAIQRVTPKHIENSSLTLMEWMYIPKSMKEFYKGYPPETCDYIDQGSLSMVLAGKRQTTAFKNARKKMLCFEES